MSKYKLIIFDMDGTIADTSPGILNSIRYTKKMMNLPDITFEQMYSHIGPPMQESYNRNFGLVGDKLNQAIFYHKEYAMKQGYKELKLYDGIKELLNNLHNYGFKLAVATLKAHSTAVKIFESLNMTNTFDVVAGVQADNPMTKSQLLEYCINECGCDKENTVLIGDSSYDAIGAEQAKIDFIAVTYGFGFKSEQDVMEYPHIAVCNEVNQIEAIFKN